MKKERILKYIVCAKGKIRENIIHDRDVEMRG